MGVFIRKLTAWTIADVASRGNLRRASRKAARGKRRRPDVESWMLREESELLRLREELLSGAYQPRGYRFFEIHEPKRRVIAAAPFRDRVVHHALCRFMAPVLERRFIARSFSCQIGKGTTAARECCRRLTNRHPGLRPRVLGATKRRFEARRRKLAEIRDFRRLTACVFAWYQFSREGNSDGLRRAYSRRSVERQRVKSRIELIRIEVPAIG